MDGLADQIRDTLAAVTDIKIEVEPRAFKAQTVPAVDMYVTGLNALDQDVASFQDTVGGWPITIRARVSPADVYAGEDLLLALIDDEDDLSIIGALADDRTVGGLTDTLMWGTWSGYTDFPDPSGEGSFLGSLLPILIVKSHS